MESYGVFYYLSLLQPKEDSRLSNALKQQYHFNECIK